MPGLTETPTPAAFGGGHVLAMPALGLPALPALDLDPETSTVITYTYDSLYRLTAADYSDGQYFHYTYDSAGNRLTEDQSGDTTDYEYDDANRLTAINSVEYTWDDNGNLLDDGTSTYTYDEANQLISAADGVITTTLAYSGLGDRVQQTVHSVTVNYTLDLNAGLTQVLADGTSNYLYGLERIGEQQPGGFVYHLADGLGSVRQLANSSGIVTLARSYEPFGSVLSTAGPANTRYGFAGEQRDDSTGLTFLRARYLSSSSGRFLSKDAWGGDPLLPITQNGWVHANANPIMYTDPSGQCAEPVTFVLCIAAIGIGTGFIANWGVQVYRNTQAGESFWDAVHYTNLDWKDLTVSGAKGGVGATVFAVVAPVTLAGFAFTGCTAELLSGRIGALTDASWNQAANLVQGNEISAVLFAQDAQAAGFIDPKALAFDAATGAVTGVATFGLNRAIPLAGPQMSEGGVPMIRVNPGGGYTVEMSGRPGLHLPPSRAAALGYTAVNGAREFVSDLATSVLGELYPDIDASNQRRSPRFSPR